MGLYKVKGRRVIDPQGERFATATTHVGALLIAVAMNIRNHRPVIDGEKVVCSRCLNDLPDQAHEACVPRAPRCPDTPDMFSSAPVASAKTPRAA